MAETWVSLLGVKGGPAIRPGSNMPTSLLVRIAGRTILVDAGLGVTRAICDQGVPLTGIDLIIITHLHSDHYLELGPLLHTAWTAGLTRCIPVIGPDGLATYWDHFQRSMAADVDLRIADEGRVPLTQLAAVTTLAPGVIHRDDTLTIEAIRNHHPPIVDSFALRLTDGSRTIVLSGDTAPFDGWADFVSGADLLVHEAMLTAGVDAVIAGLDHPDPRLKDHILRSHTAAQDVGALASRAGVGLLALNHFVPDGMAAFGEDAWIAAVRTTWDGPLRIGRDGMRIDLPSDPATS